MFCFKFQLYMSLNKSLTIIGVNVEISDYSYRPILPVSYITQILGFESELQCAAFLKEMDLTFADDEMTKVDCKASSLKLPTSLRATQ
ncbi:hypothetical protein PGB90_005643 [Kerria lacca]